MSVFVPNNQPQTILELRFENNRREPAGKGHWRVVGGVVVRPSQPIHHSSLSYISRGRCKSTVTQQNPATTTTVCRFQEHLVLHKNIHTYIHTYMRTFSHPYTHFSFARAARGKIRRAKVKASVTVTSPSLYVGRSGGFDISSSERRLAPHRTPQHTARAARTHLRPDHDEIGALVDADRAEQRPQLAPNRIVGRLVRLVHATCAATRATHGRGKVVSHRRKGVLRADSLSLRWDRQTHSLLDMTAAEWFDQAVPRRVRRARSKLTCQKKCFWEAFTHQSVAGRGLSCMPRTFRRFDTVPGVLFRGLTSGGGKILCGLSCFMGVSLYDRL